MVIINLLLALLLTGGNSVPIKNDSRQPIILQDTSGKRPDFHSMVYTDIKWKKAEGNAFWFYYKPTLYFFGDKEFQTIPLETGDYLVFIFELRKYVLLPGYVKAEKNVEYGVEIASNKDCVFFRVSRDRFYIFDNGLYADNLENVGLNTAYRQYVFRSRRTDKRYFINEADYLYGIIGKPVGIYSE